MLTLSQIGQVLTALITLIPMVVSIVREGKIRVDAYEDLSKEIVRRMQARFDAVDAAMNGPDTDPYAPKKGATK